MEETPILTDEDYENYEKALEISAKFPEEEEDSENPYESKYEVRKLLETLAKKLENLLSEESRNTEESGKLVGPAVAGVYYLLSKNYASTQERTTGQKYCEKALKVLKFEESTWIDSDLNSGNATICLSILNFLGFLYESFDDHEQANQRLHEAERLFQTYKTQSISLPDFQPSSLDSIIKILAGKSVVEDPRDKFKEFENLHTYTLYYLAQVYKNMGDCEIAASYCEKTLARQLESGEYDSVDWSLNCATLSQYYFSKSERENYAQARHCLASAEAVILHAETEALEKLQPTDAEEESELEKIRRAKADVYRCWAVYGIAILESSQSLIVKSSGNVEKFGSELKSETDVSQSHDASISELAIKFSGINLGDLENQVGCKPVRNFEEARHVFLKTQRWLKKAKEFYTEDTYASNYVEIIQEMSRAYKALAFFETGIDRKCKMHKRRSDMLGKVLSELNQDCFLFLCRQLLFQIGETNNEILNLKLDVLEEKTETDNPQATPTPHQVQKVNLLADQAIKHFQRFIETFRDHEGNLPTKFPSDGLRPVLLCRFYMGRLWNKKLTSEPREKLVFLGKSLQEYRALVKYVEETHPESREAIQEEYEACREMVTLLPLKISRMQELLL